MLSRDVISTGPLVLRPPALGDAQMIARAAGDPVTARFLSRLPQPYTVQDALSYIGQAETRWGEGGAEFAITRDGELVGVVGLSAPDVWGAHEIGYWVAPWARGRGVASRAARAVTEWALDRGVPRVVLLAEVENVASVKVALAAGFTQEGVEREAKTLRDGRRADWVRFARLPRDAGRAAVPYLPFFSELTDGVVRLTPLAEEDAPRLHETVTEPSTARWSMIGETSLEDIARRCRYTGFWWATGQRIELAVRDAATDEFAGHLQLVQVVKELDQAMVGYSLLPRFRGRGLMTRAVRLLADWAFEHTPLHRLLAGTDVDNAASQRVLERAGFTLHHRERELFPRPGGERSDELVWLRLRAS
ncbi:GNAT family N-acetyltransferase [Thermoactinospora rubra]|uniref:GNAT family N-acetyltransferase n=1 Tax=Thermoactinospora rubra TaxID=1088767 RepID=UPI000A0F45FE|nr:GNAT family N-acetyltransferase [Thermoactinospora rubra]